MPDRGSGKRPPQGKPAKPRAKRSGMPSCTRAANESIQETVNELFGRTLGHPEIGGSPQKDQRDSHQARSACGSPSQQRSSQGRQASEGGAKCCSPSSASKSNSSGEGGLDLFKTFCAAQKLPQRKAADVDWALLLFVNQAFLEGWDVSEGVKTVAAVTDYRPELCARRALPRTRRAMQGWRNLDPGVARPPLAWPLIALIALQMAENGRVFECLAVLLMFVAYLRPGEIFGLRRRELVKSVLLGPTWAINLHPSEDMQTSKTDVNNESSC